VAADSRVHGNGPFLLGVRVRRRRLRGVSYDDASLVRLQRAFLDAPERFLRHLE
jgi:hypothetical protein